MVAAALGGGSMADRLQLLSPTPAAVAPPGVNYSAADVATFAAFGMRPPRPAMKG